MVYKRFSKKTAVPGCKRFPKLLWNHDRHEIEHKIALGLLCEHKRKRPLVRDANRFA